MQSGLFASAETQLDLPGAQIRYIESFIEQPEHYFKVLHNEIQWQRDTITIAGKQVAIPRLNAWYGDTGMRYSYSGISLKPKSWTPALLQLKTQVEQFLHTQFNSVLVNLYRNGSDSVAWHSDNEPELGAAPLIASVSLGATRRFSLRGPFGLNDDGKPEADKVQTLHIDLAAGSLLVMAGKTQLHWRHQVAKTKENVGPRINLTFRRIVSV